MNPLINDIEPFIVMEILERAQTLEAEGRNIIHSEVGKTDFAPTLIHQRFQRVLPVIRY